MNGVKSFLAFGLLSFLLGVLVCWQYHDNQQEKADQKQIKKDNKAAVVIEKETEIIYKDVEIEVEKVITKYKDRFIEVPSELTDEDIDTLCYNRYVPADVMQSVRSTFSRAWSRVDDDPNVRVERCTFDVGADSRVALNCDSGTF